MREGGAAVFTLRECAGFGRRGEKEHVLHFPISCSRLFLIESWDLI